MTLSIEATVTWAQALAWRMERHLLDPVGPGVRGEVEVAGPPAEQRVPHAATDQVKAVAGTGEPFRQFLGQGGDPHQLHHRVLLDDHVVHENPTTFQVRLLRAPPDTDTESQPTGATVCSSIAACLDQPAAPAPRSRAGGVGGSAAGA